METIAVFFGGRSAEHDVSIITALTSIIKPLELTKKYTVVPVYIAKDGQWYVSEKLKDIGLYQGDQLDAFLRTTKPSGVVFDKGMKLIVPAKLGRKEVAIDIAFPAMHGTYGEDGALMGLLDMAGVAYVGCGVAASAVAMDKVLAKQLAKANSLPVTAFLSYQKKDALQDIANTVKEIEKTLKYPLFVKPAHLGSSIGITRVTDALELRNAIEVALHYDDLIIVEEAVDNLIEVTLPIMGNAGEPTPALLERPLTTANNFFDFDTKYMHGGKKGGKKGSAAGAQGYSQLPAELPKRLYDEAVQIGISIYRAFGCSGIARVDMLIDSKTEQIYFNEMNPLPGSLYAHNWMKAGVSKVDLVEKLLGFARERDAERHNLARTFDTNFLKQF